LYKSKDEDETLRRALAAEIPPLEERGFPEFEQLEALVQRALAREPDRRFQSGGELMRALGDYLHVSGMIVSQLRFADFLMDNFGEDLLAQRRERERNLEASIDRLTMITVDAGPETAGAALEAATGSEPAAAKVSLPPPAASRGRAVAIAVAVIAVGLALAAAAWFLSS
ncbi:MAG TPA: hypothetical protein VM285_03915, partial [Polyangia bacterium]|nr:hypothetical protein [Polyangia bacterium]